MILIFVQSCVISMLQSFKKIRIIRLKIATKLRPELVACKKMSLTSKCCSTAKDVASISRTSIQTIFPNMGSSALSQFWGSVNQFYLKFNQTFREKTIFTSTAVIAVTVLWKFVLFMALWYLVTEPSWLFECT